ncbi:MAG: M23 family metallopeptidase [Flavobacteriaceae bacterium]|nr:M23 family metallopeptidase [Flavobacteriaceae bacterium]
MSKKKAKQKKTIKKKLTRKYRLVILNEDSFEERLSFKINRLNVLIFGGVFSIFLISITSIIIAYSPLKEYIPGYSSTALKQKATHLVYKSDSLTRALNINNAYLETIRKVLIGKIDTFPDFNRDTILNNKPQTIDEKELNPSVIDSVFREQVELKDRYTLFNKATKNTKVVFFAPVLGSITQDFNIKEKHYAIDIAVKTGTPVKSAADGTIIFAEWTVETGYVIIIEHTNGFLSVYKHNATILKKQGDLVTSGEVIATVGSTGEFTTGPHLHFELWNDGYPIDPSQFIDFE